MPERLSTDPRPFRLTIFQRPAGAFGPYPLVSSARISLSPGGRHHISPFVKVCGRRPQCAPRRHHGAASANLHNGGNGQASTRPPDLLLGLPLTCDLLPWGG